MQIVGVHCFLPNISQMSLNTSGETTVELATQSPLIVCFPSLFLLSFEGNDQFYYCYRHITKFTKFVQVMLLQVNIRTPLSVRH